MYSYILEFIIWEKIGAVFLKIISHNVGLETLVKGLYMIYILFTL